MNNGWLELESDPGVFTFLLEDFGVKGVQVEEIYDLQQKSMEGPVYGFIFLFRWIEERRSRRKVNMTEDTFVMDEDTMNSIFFAQQVIPNSCATHALLSVLLNCEKVQLGETLSKLKQFTKHMSPENKGFAIGNLPELAKAHYSHARPEPRQLPDKQQGVSTVRTMEAFHFVSYVPINGRLFELDGLKPHPVDHGPWNEDEDWTEKFRRVITERLGIATGGEPYHDIRFNLMAVVPDRRQQYEQKLTTLKTNRQIVLETLQQMVKVTSPRIGQSDTSTSGMEIDTESGDVIGQLGEKGDSLIENHVMDESEIAATSNAVEEQKYVVVTCSGDVSNVTSITDSKLKIQISVTDDAEGSITIPRTVATTDVTKPLTIETKFSSGTSSGPSSESTDTASEVGSCLSSPSSTTHSSQNSPNLSEIVGKLKQEATSLDVVSAAGIVTPKHDSLSVVLEAAASSRHQSSNSEAESVASSSSMSHGSSRSSKTKFSSQHGFTPKDLLALLKNVENEIEICEANLRDEIEKRSRYKIDDNRRTHNYDKFIFSFLSMLAEQGTLHDLVAEHCTVKRRQGVTVGRLHQSKASGGKRKARGKRKR